MTQDTRPLTRTTRSPVKWRHSMYFRVLVLCCVLVLCLFAAIFVIARYTVGEASRELQTRSIQIAEELYRIVEDNPSLEHEIVENILMENRADTDIEIRPILGEKPEQNYYAEFGEDGRVRRVFSIPLDKLDVVMTVHYNSMASTEILQAFKNRYIIMVAFVFIITLWIMVYSMHRMLRPLMDLSDACAAITEGELESVRVASSSGEVQLLERKFNDMVASLREKEVMEVKLRQAQRLSALGNLAAGVAHDVRNPLNAIKLLSSHTIDSLPGEENERATKPLMTIRDEVDRLEDIVSGFLSLAKERELAPEPNKVDGLLAECVRLFQKDAEAREVSLVAELNAGETMLLLDSKQWPRAILNVLLNALEACETGGHVRISSRPNNGACHILVEDDGPGLPQNIAEQVFDPYYTTKPGGTGLGLSITRGIVEEHGGTIELDSVEGQGCRVLIVMPLEQKIVR
jgi:two-component system, NtrC family, sensor histidine kinase HydH